MQYFVSYIYINVVGMSITVVIVGPKNRVNVGKNSPKDKQKCCNRLKNCQQYSIFLFRLLKLSTELNLGRHYINWTEDQTFAQYYDNDDRYVKDREKKSDNEGSIMSRVTSHDTCYGYLVTKYEFTVCFGRFRLLRVPKIIARYLCQNCNKKLLFVILR